MRSAAFALTLVLAPLAIDAGPVRAADAQVRIYNWADYIDEDVLKGFEAETGIKPVYEEFDSADTLETRLLAGKSGYDVVVAPAPFLARQAKAGLFRKLDKAKLPNLANLSPEIAARAARFDPGGAYSVTYLWGTNGIGYNVDRVRAAFPDAPLDSWALVFDPANLARLKGCGVTLPDSPEELLPAVMAYLGLPADWSNVKNVERAADHLARLKPFLARFSSDDYVGALADGSACVAVGSSIGVLRAKGMAENAGRGVRIAYSIPKEGAPVWLDQLAIPADAPRPEAAHRFIDYLLRPEVAAKITNAVEFANANAKALPLVEARIAGDRGVYPTPAAVSALYAIPPIDNSWMQMRMSRAWTRMKTGKAGPL